MAAKLTKANVQAFLTRPWQELADLKDEYWRRRFEADKMSTFEAAESLWELLHAAGRTTDIVSRQADLEHHLHLRALIDRANASLKIR